MNNISYELIIVTTILVAHLSDASFFRTITFFVTYMLIDNYNRCCRVVTSWSSYICIRIYQMRKSTDELRKLRYINFCALSFAAFSEFIADEFERRKFCGSEKCRIRSSEEK